jgi:hypothetical protein
VQAALSARPCLAETQTADRKPQIHVEGLSVPHGMN